jgi:chromosome segregation ATPase
VAFRTTAAELTRQYKQNKNDIDELYRLAEEIKTAVLETTGNLTTRVDGVETKVDNLTTRVGAVETKVDNLTTRVSGVETEVAHLTTRVSGVETEVAHLTSRVGAVETGVARLTTRVSSVETKVDNLTTQVDERFGHVDERFDRIEQLLTSPPQRRVVPSPQNIPGTPQEKRLGLLDMRINGAVERSIANQEEIARHSRMFDAHEARFDSLDSQMAEVLGILRGKSA